MGLDLQPDGLTAGLAGHCQPDNKISTVSEKKKLFVRLLQEKQYHILSTDVVQVKSACVTNVNPVSKISKFVMRISFSNSKFPSKSIEKGLVFNMILDIMQVTFVTVPTVVLPTASFNSQGMDTQVKTSNVTEHMPVQFQLSYLQAIGI